jgi:hypothetical protein
VNASLNRLAGTAIGAGLGGLLVALWGSHVWALGAAATLTVWSCAVLGLRDSYRLASATVALHRFLEVAVGILVALLVTLLMWPSRTWQALEALELATRGSQDETYHHCFEPELGHLLGEISAAFHRLAENVAMAHGAFASTDLERAASAVDDKATAIRTSGVSMSYSLEEVSRFYAFLISVKSLVKALEWAETDGSPARTP